MSAAATENKAEFKCSCGRTFAHEISLKRHCWVTGHTAEEVAAPAPAPAAAEAAAPATEDKTVEVPIQLPDVADHAAVSEALRILQEKRMEQEAFEARQARERQIRAAVQTATEIVHTQVQRAAETSRRGAEVVRESMLLALRMLLMILICGGLLVTGMGIGRLLASPANASPAPAGAQRQLVGFQAQQ